jgi:hypothetical protein
VLTERCREAKAERRTKEVFEEGLTNEVQSRNKSKGCGLAMVRKRTFKLFEKEVYRDAKKTFGESFLAHRKTTYRFPNCLQPRNPTIL